MHYENKIFGQDNTKPSKDLIFTVYFTVKLGTLKSSSKQWLKAQSQTLEMLIKLC